MNPQMPNPAGPPQGGGIPQAPNGMHVPMPQQMQPTGPPTGMGMPPQQQFPQQQMPPAGPPTGMGMPQQPMPQMPQMQPQPGASPMVGATQPPLPVTAPKGNPNSTQNTLQIAEIRDGIVIMNDGSFRSVVQAKSINFDLMSQNEQESIEYSYQSFLNSLYFPIQIFIRSQKVDLAPYIQKLDKIRTEHDNMLLALLMDDYIGYIDALSQQTNIMDKTFLITVPYFPKVDAQKALDQSKNFFSGVIGLFNTKETHVVVNEADLETAKTELRNRVQSILQGLIQCGVQAVPLDTQELIELYYDVYNPDTATRQPLKHYEDLSADIITKGQGMAPQPHLDRELS